MAADGFSPYSSLNPIGDTKLADSMPDGYGVTGLTWLPTGAGRALFGGGIALMVLFGWLAFSTYARPSIVWTEVASVTIQNPNAVALAAGRGAPSSPTAVDIPVAGPGRYTISVLNASDLAGYEPGDAVGWWDRYRDPEAFRSSSIEAARDDQGRWIVHLEDGRDSQAGRILRSLPRQDETVTVFAVPLDDPPTRVHVPTFRRDLILVGLGLVLFVVGFTLRHRYVKVLKARARAIEESLDAAKRAAG